MRKFAAKEDGKHQPSIRCASTHACTQHRCADGLLLGRHQQEAREMATRHARRVTSDVAQDGCAAKHSRLPSKSGPTRTVELSNSIRPFVANIQCSCSPRSRTIANNWQLEVRAELWAHIRAAMCNKQSRRRAYGGHQSRAAVTQSNGAVWERICALARAPRRCALRRPHTKIVCHY